MCVAQNELEEILPIQAYRTTHPPSLGQQYDNSCNFFWVDANGRIFERADAFNSLNVVSTQHINFSLQADRTTDPTTETIALPELQLIDQL